MGEQANLEEGQVIRISQANVPNTPEKNKTTKRGRGRGRGKR